MMVNDLATGSVYIDPYFTADPRLARMPIQCECACAPFIFAQRPQLKRRVYWPPPSVLGWGQITFIILGTDMRLPLICSTISISILEPPNPFANSPCLPWSPGRWAPEKPRETRRGWYEDAIEASVRRPKDADRLANLFPATIFRFQTLDIAVLPERPPSRTVRFERDLALQPPGQLPSRLHMPFSDR
jgi:hypothetical protein